MAFRELVTTSKTLMASVAFLMSILISATLKPSLELLFPAFQSISGSITLVAGLFVLGYLISTVTYGVRIKITTYSLLNGPGHEYISVLGASHGGRIYVPCKDIIEVTDIEYVLPFLKTFTAPYIREGVPNSHVIRLPGYNGRGISIRYTTDHNGIATLDFPTRRASEIKEALLLLKKC